jgi:hypothetical protein
MDISTAGSSGTGMEKAIARESRWLNVSVPWLRHSERINSPELFFNEQP